MGAVFRARHHLTERAVALKWMLPEVGGEEAVQRFLREARAMGRIDHAGVVGVLDVGVDEGATFLVMELLKGNSLRDIMEVRERIDPAEAIALLMPALEGVEAAHQNGVVHRDLKPENIFVVRAGDGSIETTKVLDFGISKLRDDRLE
jgi:serine/threonine-protein kinase